MINAINLLWIIPISAIFGFVFCAILSVNEKGNK